MAYGSESDTLQHYILPVQPWTNYVTSVPHLEIGDHKSTYVIRALRGSNGEASSWRTSVSGDHDNATRPKTKFQLLSGFFFFSFLSHLVPGSPPSGTREAFTTAGGLPWCPPGAAR